MEIISQVIVAVFSTFIVALFKNICKNLKLVQKIKKTWKLIQDLYKRD